MLENFSVHAQRVVSLATAEARMLDHARVGTEHLLLGLLSSADGVADVLRTAGGTLAAARHKVAEVVGADTGSPDGEALPFTPRAQRALERAGRFSRQDREPEVTPEHVLLGVLDVEGLACQVLRGLGVDVVRLRDAVVAGTDAAANTAVDTADTADTAVDEPPLVPSERPRCPGCRAALDETLSEAMIPARRADQSTTKVNVEANVNVSVVFCAACGTALGVLPLA